MGTLEVQVEVAGAARDRYAPIDVLVDTGSTYTVLPCSLLLELAVAVEDTSRFELADGTGIEREIGYAWIRLDGRERYTQVVFGDAALIGAVTLEQFLLAPDPVHARLIAVPGLMMRIAA